MLQNTISHLSDEKAIESLGSDGQFGLHEREVFLRKKEYGENIIPKVNIINVILSICSPFLLFLLLVSFLVTFFTNSIFISALSVLLLIFHSITYFLYRFDNLKKYIDKRKFIESILPQKSNILRNGKIISINIKNLVPGDIIYLERGEKVPADIRILSTNRLVANESMIFGQQNNFIEKSFSALDITNINASNILFAGSLLTEGSAKGIIYKIGRNRKIFSIFKTTCLENNSNLDIQLRFLSFFYWGVLIILLLMIYFLNDTVINLAQLSILLLFISPYFLPLILLIYSDNKSRIYFEKESNNLFIPIDDLIVSNDTFHSKIWIQDKKIDISNAKQIKNSSEFLKSFSELFFLSLPEDNLHKESKDLIEIKEYLEKRCKSSICTPQSLVYIPENSSFTRNPTNNSIVSKTVYENIDDPLNSLIIYNSHPLLLLQNSTYIWDKKAHEQKRRLFLQEKEDLYKSIQNLEANGNSMYGIAIETREKVNESKHLVFVGFLIIPQKTDLNILGFIQKIKSLKKKLFFYSNKLYNTEFLVRNIGISFKNITTPNTIFGKSIQYKEKLIENDIHVFNGISNVELMDIFKYSKKSGDSLMYSSEKTNDSFIDQTRFIDNEDKLSDILNEQTSKFQKSFLMRNNIAQFCEYFFILGVIIAFFSNTLLIQNIYLLPIAISSPLFVLIYLNMFNNNTVITKYSNSEQKFLDRIYSNFYFLNIKFFLEIILKFLIIAITIIPLLIITYLYQISGIQNPIAVLIFDPIIFESILFILILTFFTNLSFYDLYIKKNIWIIISSIIIFLIIYLPLTHKFLYSILFPKIEIILYYLSLIVIMILLIIFSNIINLKNIRKRRLEV